MTTTTPNQATTAESSPTSSADHGATRTALVTGASSGIGEDTARRLQALGCIVYGAARRTDRLQALAAGGIRPLAMDVTDDASVTAGVNRILEETGRIDILVNNVGAGDLDHMGLGGFLDSDDSQWHHLLNLNLFSAVWTSKAALPSLIERRGAIVNLGSVNARFPSTGPVGYSEAKAALVAFGKRLSEEFGPQGVRVNTVSPGPVGTGLWRDPDGFGAQVAAANGAPHADFLTAMPATFGITSGRISEPEEVAALIAFLASPAAGNITGTEIIADGGIIKTT